MNKTQPGDDYFGLMAQIQRIHRHYMDLIKQGLTEARAQSLTSAQGLLICKLGDGPLTVGRLSSRCYHLGSSLTYNLKKLVNAGYIEQIPFPHDRRSSLVSLTSKGRVLRAHLIAVQCRHAARLPVSAEEFGEMRYTLAHLESVWAYAATLTHVGAASDD